MKKIIRLTESDLARIVKRVIKENEEDWINQSQDIEMESDFSQMEKLKDIEEFQELVDIFKNDKELADYYRERLGMNVNESYKYYDYGDNKKEITKSHYRKRKLATYTVTTLVSAIVGYMMGTIAQDQVLEAALLAAGMGGLTFGSLASEVGRERVKDDEQINEMEDEDFMRDADRNWREREDYGTMRGGFFDDEEEDEEWGETDRGEEELQDLIEEARDFLENECGYEIEELNSMSEDDIVEAVFDEGNVELAEKIDKLLDFEGFYNGEEEEELGEGWDDFTQKRRHPEDYKPEKYRSIPKDFFRKNIGRRIDPEGTTLSIRQEDPFDEYEDLTDMGNERGWRHRDDDVEDDDYFNDEEFV